MIASSIGGDREIGGDRQFRGLRYMAATELLHIRKIDGIRERHQRRDRPASHACIRHTAYPQELRALFYNAANLDSR